MGKQELTTPRGTEVQTPFQSRAFTTLQREIDRLFDDFGRGWDRFTAPPSLSFPKIDVTESDTEIELTAELPGLEEKDIKVEVADNLLTVSGEKQAESERKEKNLTVSERTYGAFSRTIALPPGVDPSMIKAAVSKGVLKVTAPKPASAKAAKIEVKAG